MKPILPFSLLLALAISAAQATADAYDPPPSYYSGATGTGATLKMRLAAAMSAGHIQRSYGDFRFSAALSDADPNQPGNILLTYDRASVPADWDSGATWNREHVWPVSLPPGGSPSNSTTGHKADPHALRPADSGVNSSRSNSPFGLDATTGLNGYIDGTFYFPGDADKGDIARQLFYSDTRYASLGLSLVEGAPSGNEMGDLSALIAWHYFDPPDEFERRRNHVIYSQDLNPSYYANNRSAYVDHPEYAWSVYVDQANDSQLALAGATVDEAGASAVNLDFGAVLVGAPAPFSQTLALEKNGQAGTYFEVTTTGGAVSSIEGRHNAFPIGQGYGQTFLAGLSANTSSAGLQSGSIVIDNLDVTTGGGTGRGANDADDVVNVSLSVLNHAQPSFSGADRLTSLTLDFGTVALGAVVSPLGVDLFNVVDTAGFTAGLDLDSIVGSGDTDVLASSIELFSESLAAGSSNSFVAMPDTSSVGAFAASYVLSFSDEDLPGALSLDGLTLNLTGVVEASADFDDSGSVDGSDFLIWQRGFGLGEQSDNSNGDADGSGSVDEQDVAVWQARYGDTRVAVGVVPEPETFVLTVVCMLLAVIDARPIYRVVMPEAERLAGEVYTNDD